MLVFRPFQAVVGNENLKYSWHYDTRNSTPSRPGVNWNLPFAKACLESHWDSFCPKPCGSLWFSIYVIFQVGLLSHVNVEEHPNLTILRKSSEEWSVFAKVMSISSSSIFHCLTLNKITTLLHGRIWFIIISTLYARINLPDLPPLKLPPEDLIIRWANHHLRHTDYRGPGMRDFDSSLKVRNNLWKNRNQIFAEIHHVRTL